MRRFTKSIRMVAGLLTGLLFATSAVPLGAQPAHQSHPFYDISKEVTLRGTVSDVLAKAAPGTMAGPHLLFATSRRGKWTRASEGSLCKARTRFPSLPGKEVEVTGVMKTVKNRDVFVARIVRVDGKAYKLRNQHGVPMSPLSRERASQKAAQKGESL
jgi:DNA/RNA endonuclease YhcR with UshA esterase domain